MNESRSNTKRVTPQKRKREEKAAPQPPSEAEAEEEPKKIVVPTGERAKTQAERKFEEVKRRRVRKILANQFRIFKRSKQQAERDIEKMASKSHRQKVEEFNKQLDKLPTHFDIPKVFFILVFCVALLIFLCSSGWSRLTLAPRSTVSALVCVVICTREINGLVY